MPNADSISSSSSLHVEAGHDVTIGEVVGGHKTTVQQNASGAHVIQVVGDNNTVVAQMPAAEAWEARLARATVLLESRAYAEAASLLEALIHADPTQPQPRWLFALARLAGRSPDVLSPADVQTIETHLTVARALGPTAIALIALAVVKHDYYVINGRAPGSPTVDELLGEIGSGPLPNADRKWLAHLAASRRIKQRLRLEW